MMNNDREKKRGRPLKYADELRTLMHISVSAEDRNRIKLSGKPAHYFLEFGIHALLGDPDENELNEINERLSEIEPEYFELKTKKRLIEEKIRKLKEIRHNKEIEEEYMRYAFCEILKKQKQHNMIIIKPSWIEENYGIAFDIEKVNRDFASAIEDSDMPAYYVIEKYGIRKIGRGKMENQIVLEIVKKEEKKENEVENE